MDDIRKILGFLKNVKSWVDFVACVNLVVTKGVQLTPIYQWPIENQETVHLNDVENRSIIFVIDKNFERCLPSISFYICK